MSGDIVDRIEKLEQAERGLLNSHRTLMAKYEQTRVPRYKQVASKALDEAGKIRREINKLKQQQTESNASTPGAETHSKDTEEKGT